MAAVFSDVRFGGETDMELTGRHFRFWCCGRRPLCGKRGHFQRWAEPSQMRAVVAELVASADVIVANGTSVLNAVRQATNSIPVVFTGISDPEGLGIVANLAWPGGNMTGLANFEPSMGGKWLQTLKEIAPQLTRVGVLRVAETQVRILQSIKDYAASSGMEAVDCPVRDGPGIRAAIGAFDGQPATGLIVLPDPVFSTYRALIFELAANQHHPAIYAAPQTVQTASPVCGAKNFVLVRLYSAPQLIGQLSPFPEYAPKARAIKPDSAATIKLTNYRREGNT